MRNINRSNMYNIICAKLLALSFSRTRHLKCERQSCEELVVAHLGFLDYSYYIITVRFHGLESFHQRYTIRELTFYVSKHCTRNVITALAFDMTIPNLVLVFPVHSLRTTIRRSRKSRSGSD